MKNITLVNYSTLQNVAYHINDHKVERKPVAVKRIRVASAISSGISDSGHMRMIAGPVPIKSRRCPRKADQPDLGLILPVFQDTAEPARQKDRSHDHTIADRKP
jgi:hypothetical protein